MTIARFKSVPDTEPGANRLRATATQQPTPEAVSYGTHFGTTDAVGTAVLTPEAVQSAVTAANNVAIGDENDTEVKTGSLNQLVRDNLDAKISDTTNASNFTDAFPESVLINAPTGPVGPGGTAFTVTAKNTLGNPLSGVSVWVTSDLAGTTTIAGTLTTDALGSVVFMLPTGTAYVWRMSPTYTFPNPQAITVT